MPEEPDDLLSGSDQPRPLPPALRDRLERRLLAGTEAARPLDPELSARLTDDLTDPVALLLTDVDGPKDIPPDLRRRLSARLTHGRARRRRWLAAVAATVIVPAGAGVAIQRLTRSSSSRSNVAAPAKLPDRFAPEPSGATASASGQLTPVGGSQPVIAAQAGPAPATPQPVNPGAGPNQGGTSVTITGTGFTGVTGVRFDQTPATRFQVISDREIRAIVPQHPPGPVSVYIVTTAGTRAVGTYVYQNN